MIARAPHSALDIYVSFAEAAALEEFTTERRIYGLATRDNTRPVKKTGNGRPKREINLAALSASAQARYFERLPKIMGIASTLGELPASAVAAPRERVDVPDKFRGRVDCRLRAIRPLIDFGSVKGRARRAEYAALLESQAAKLGKHIDTLRDWLARFRKRGEVGLAPKLREDEKESRFFNDHPNAAIFAQAMKIRERANVRAIFESLRREWKGPQLEEEDEPPSYNTVRRYLEREISHPLEVLAGEGKEAYVSKCAPSIIRSEVPVMHTFVSDHRVHDVFVRNTCWSHLKPNQLYRPWMTAIYDWGSRKILGVVWATSPSSRTINSAIRMAVAHAGGFPRNFYWDNGKDYRAVGRILLSPELSALLASQAVQFSEEGVNGVERFVKHALPKRPRGKPIESWFAFWAKRFDPIWRPAYAGNKPSNCPADCKEAQKQHEQFLAGKRGSTHIPTDEEFMILAAQWADEYNERPLAQLDGKTANQVFDEQWPEENRRRPDPRMLARLFWEKEIRTVLPGGCFDLDSMRYKPKPEYIGVLADLQKQKVKVLRDPYNLGDGIVVDAESGEFLGEIMLQPRIGQSDDPITREAIKSSMREQRTVQKLSQNYIDGIYGLARAKGIMTEREALRERALGTGTYGRAIDLIAPGVNAAPVQMTRAAVPALAPRFVSEGVKEDTFDISQLEMEE
jgi:transposase InsO family protein